MARNVAQRLTAIVAIVAAGVLAIACGPGTASPPSPAATTSPSSSVPAASAVAWGDGSALKVSSGGSGGPFLTDAAGRALYTYSNDSTMSACNGSCKDLWPPLLASGESSPPSATAGVTKPIGTGERADGTFQVTYGGAWLYYSAADLAPGDVRGDGIDGVWHLAKP